MVSLRHPGGREFGIGHLVARRARVAETCHSHPMPDIKDAIEVVTDPKHVNSSDTHSELLVVNGKRAVRALRDRGAKPAEARTLINDAVSELGGAIGSEMQVGGRAVGPDSRRAADVWRVPRAAVRTARG